MRWRDVVEYVQTVKGLLLGEQVDWDGAKIQMLHYPEFAAPRPISVPWLFAVGGPKGNEAAREHAVGILDASGGVGAGFDWSVSITVGTVLDDGEDPGSPRTDSLGARRN